MKLSRERRENGKRLKELIWETSGPEVKAVGSLCGCHAQGKEKMEEESRVVVVGQF